MITRQITTKAGNVASVILTRGGSGIPLGVRFGGINSYFTRDLKNRSTPCSGQGSNLESQSKTQMPPPYPPNLHRDSSKIKKI